MKGMNIKAKRTVLGRVTFPGSELYAKNVKGVAVTFEGIKALVLIAIGFIEGSGSVQKVRENKNLEDNL